jgi:hypothetical protein
MKEVYLVRHAALDADGVPTPDGLRCAQAVGQLLPAFDAVISGGDVPTGQTAIAMAGREGAVDERAGIGPPLDEHLQELWEFERLPKKLNISQYVEYVFADGTLEKATRSHATELGWLAQDLLDALDEGQSGLIVSYGLCIMRAMWPAYLQRRPILHGYGFRLESSSGEKSLTRFAPPEVKPPRPGRKRYRI